MIASCRDSLVAYWMKAMTRTLPVATYLYTINPIKHSPCCTQCDQGASQKESLSHFLSACPKFHHARTEAHNQICKVLAASLQKHFAAHWSPHSETPLSKTGLVLELVPTARVLRSGRQVWDSDTTVLQMTLGRWQPDFMAMLLDQRYTDCMIHLLKTCLRLAVELLKATDI